MVVAVVVVLVLVVCVLRASSVAKLGFEAIEGEGAVSRVRPVRAS